MKAVIFFSGLAGLILFGPPILRHHSSRHDVHVVVHEAKHVHQHVSGQDNCRFEGERSFTASASGIQELWLRAGSGELVVEGVEGLNELRGTARACASSQDLLDGLDLISETDGSTFRVETHHPDMSGWRGGNRYARLDLHVEVPAGMAADIQDGSGGLILRDLGAVMLKDGSGEAGIEGIRGDLNVVDGSGELTISDVTGVVVVEDSSGELLLVDLASDLELRDSSGEIEIRGVGGAVTLFDGSGEIDIRDVFGTVTVVRDGSGEIDVRGVGGDFVVERDGSGSIRYEGVEGRVDVPKKKKGR